jgi:hypothetical protein
VAAAVTVATAAAMDVVAGTAGTAAATVTAVVTAATAVAATVKNAPTRWADRQLMKIRQRAHTTRAMLMRH